MREINKEGLYEDLRFKYKIEFGISIVRNTIFIGVLKVGLFFCLLSLFDFNKLELGNLNPIISDVWKFSLVIGVLSFLFFIFDSILSLITSYIPGIFNWLVAKIEE